MYILYMYPWRNKSCHNPYKGTVYTCQHFPTGQHSHAVYAQLPTGQH